nr:hypothetical protein [Tanacetum cinerariifolium]
MLQTESELHLNKGAKVLIFLSTLKKECPNLECHNEELVLLCRMVGDGGRLDSIDAWPSMFCVEFCIDVEEVCVLASSCPMTMFTALGGLLSEAALLTLGG